MGNTKIKMTPSCSPRRVRNMYFLTLKGQFENLASGQVRLRSDHDPGRSICTSSIAARRAKSFGTICASLSPSRRDLLAKNELWPHLISGDLPVTSDRQLHPDMNRWGEWPWSWNNWVVLICLCETGSTHTISAIPRQLKRSYMQAASLQNLKALSSFLDVKWLKTCKSRVT